MIILRIMLAILGILLVIWTFLSAAKTFVVPRSNRQRLTGSLFVASRKLFTVRPRVPLCIDVIARSGTSGPLRKRLGVRYRIAQDCPAARGLSLKNPAPGRVF